MMGFFSQDGLVTMHDVMDAQWVLDNNRDGESVELFISGVKSTVQSRT